MFLYIFSIIAALMILKPVRNSLFLVNFGVEKLPYVFILVAFLAAGISFLRAKLEKRTTVTNQILSTSVVSIIALLGFWLFLRGGYYQYWLFFGLYVFVSMFGVITSAQFWILANSIFDAREAKRLFGFIGTGAIAGAIFGGYLTNYLAPGIKTENMILVGAGFVAVSILLLFVILSHTRQRMHSARDGKARISDESSPSDNPIRLIAESKHLIFLSVLICVGVCVGNLADYQFSAIASRSIADEDKLTAFFGFWMSNLNVLSLLLQMFLTGRIIRHYGAGTALFFLPAGLLVGTIAVMVSPVLWTAIFIKTSDGAFKHSINRSGTELLFIPIPAGVKNKVKTFIDIVIKNMATGFAGLFLILLTTVFHFSVQHVGYLNALLIALWLYLIFGVRREYVNLFRNAIHKRHIDLAEQSLNVEDAAVLKHIKTILMGDNERQITYVLELIERTRNKELVPCLERLLDFPSDTVKAAALNMAQDYGEMELSDKARKLVYGKSHELRTAAIGYLCTRSRDRVAVLRTYINHDDAAVQDAALLCAAREWRQNQEFKDAVDIKEVIEEKYKALSSSPAGPGRMRSFLVNAAGAIGESGDERLYPHLAFMFNQTKYPEVVRAAVISAGRTGSREFIPFLIRHLKTKDIRTHARTSLIRYGEDAIETLARYFENTAGDNITRLSIAGVLAKIDSARSVSVLERNLDQEDPKLLFTIIKALNKLRAKYPELRFDKNLIRTSVLRETENYIRTSMLLLSVRTNGRPGSKKDATGELTPSAGRAKQLLVKALEEKLDLNLERIFRLLGLNYDAKEMYDTYLGIMSNKPGLRANAVEFLDNVLDKSLKQALVPIVERGPEAARSNKLWARFGDSSLTDRNALNVLLEINDPWINICAMYLIAMTGDAGLTEKISRRQADPNPMIRETARFCMERVTRTA